MVIMASSSWNHGKSTLFLPKRGSLENVPFSNDNVDNGKSKDTAGDRRVQSGSESNGEDLMNDLDGLTEEELDELLQEARDINQRLKSFERRQCNSRSLGDQSFALAEERSSGEHTSGAKQNPFLPPLEQTKTSLVTGVKLVEGTTPDLAGRHKKASVT